MDNDKVVFIRTDGNDDIASGHLMRCISIAQSVIKYGGKVHFIVSDMQSSGELMRRLERVISRKSVTVTVLETDYRKVEDELPVLKHILSEQPDAVLLVDTYFVTPDYFREVRKLAKVYYMDDLQMFDYPVDGVINYDVIVDKSFYTLADNVYTESQYTPLREQFAKSSYTVRMSATELLLTTGGTDPNGFCKKFIDGFLKQEGMAGWRIHLIIGTMFADKKTLMQIAKKDNRVVAYENVKNMAELMASCDLAVSAGGTTLFELCAVGVPTISISISQNQIPCNEAFSKAGIIPYEGYVSSDDRNMEEILQHLYAKVMELGSNLSERQKMNQRQRKAVDGKGADRIASLLLCQ